MNEELIQKDILYEESKIPDDLQRQVNEICKKYSQQPNIYESIYYLGRNCLYCILVILMTLILRDYLNPVVLFLGYSILMGTVTMGLWVLGHDMWSWCIW